MNQSSIGILLISTWKYNKFIDPIISDIKKYLFPNNTKKIYLHTDSNERHDAEKILNIEHKPWPMVTLSRFETFSNFSHEYDTDYLFYLDVDSKIISAVDDDILSDFTVVKHHWFIGSKGTPETNKKSLAYIDPLKPTIYIAGGFFGGTKKRFISVSQELSNNINIDLNNNIIALWHDESHLNRYYSDNQDTIKVISSEYMYSPANKKHPLPNPKIIPFLDKEKGFDKFEGKIHK